MIIRKQNMIKKIFLYLVSIFIINLQGGVKKEIRRELSRGMVNRAENVQYELDRRIERHKIGKKYIKNIIQSARNNIQDYYNYTVKSISTKIQGNNHRTKIIFNINHISSLQEDHYVFQKVKKITDRINNQGLNPHLREKAVNDYLVKNLDYDETLEHESPYNALKKGETTCRGYALLTNLLLEEVGIRNKIVIGKLKENNESHAWNLAEIEGKWFHLDVTQNDAGSRSINENYTYDWYNLSDKEMRNTHSWNNRNYPGARSNYYKVLNNRKADFGSQEKYKNLIKELELHFLQDKFTIVTRKKLSLRLNWTLHRRQKSISFRTSNNFISLSKIKNTLRSLYQKNDKLSSTAQINKIKLRKRNYSRDKYKNTVIAKIHFYYSDPQKTNIQ